MGQPGRYSARAQMKMRATASSVGSLPHTGQSASAASFPGQTYRGFGRVRPHKHRSFDDGRPHVGRMREDGCRCAITQSSERSIEKPRKYADARNSLIRRSSVGPCERSELQRFKKAFRSTLTLRRLTPSGDGAGFASAVQVSGKPYVVGCRNPPSLRGSARASASGHEGKRPLTTTLSTSTGKPVPCTLWPKS
jgi:hypothetical protein